MISRIGQARGRPVLFPEGRRGMITSHSSSVTSVLYRLVLRICCLRVVGSTWRLRGWSQQTPGITFDSSHSTPFETASKLFRGKGCGGMSRWPSRLISWTKQCRSAIRRR